jgi:Neuraminidase (sialidase)
LGQASDRHGQQKTAHAARADDLGEVWVTFADVYAAIFITPGSLTRQRQQFVRVGVMVIMVLSVFGRPGCVKSRAMMA